MFMNNENIQERLIVILKKNEDTGIYEGEFRGLGYINETDKIIIATVAKSDRIEGMSSHAVNGRGLLFFLCALLCACYLT